MIRFDESPISGCYEVQNFVSKDSRGKFVKIYQKSRWPSEVQLPEMVEDFYSISQKDVLRGFHFQLPPHDHAKLVTCMSGKILDVVVDLRKDSLTYGQTASFVLSAESCNSVLIPVGLGHAFLALEDKSLMYYQVSSEYHKESESGILWNSVDFEWPVLSPLLSERDQKFQSFKDFVAPDWSSYGKK